MFVALHAVSNGSSLGLQTLTPTGSVIVCRKRLNQPEHFIEDCLCGSLRSRFRHSGYLERQFLLQSHMVKSFLNPRVSLYDGKCVRVSSTLFRPLFSFQFPHVSFLVDLGQPHLCAHTGFLSYVVRVCPHLIYAVLQLLLVMVTFEHSTSKSFLKRQSLNRCARIQTYSAILWLQTQSQASALSRSTCIALLSCE